MDPAVSVSTETFPSWRSWTRDDTTARAYPPETPVPRAGPAPPPAKPWPRPPGSFDPASLSPKERFKRLRRSARTEYAASLRSLSTAALLDLAEGLWWSLDDPDWSDADRAFVVLGRGEDLRLAERELARRRRLVAGGRRVPLVYRAHSEGLTTLVRAIHESVELAEVLVGYGYVLCGAARAEAHGPCPVCGGTDRFVIWPPPRSRGWCRQCGWSADVIGFYQWFHGELFADAVLAVARLYLGIGVGEGR